DAQHVCLAVVELDLEVVVGDPASEHAHPGVSPRPDALDDVLVHRATLEARCGYSRCVRVAVTGSSGLIGSALLPVLGGEGHELIRVVRREPAAPDEVGWDPEAGTIDAHGLAGVDAIVNLAGHSIGMRWTASRKHQIVESRVGGTKLL